MTDATLLLEVGTEELPPKHLSNLCRQFTSELTTALTQWNLHFGEVSVFSTPRRLAVLIRGVPARQADIEQVRRGPSLRAAFNDQDLPTPAALGFAKSCGVDLKELERIEVEGEGYLSFRQLQPGKTLEALLQLNLGKLLHALPAPKKMRWGTHSEPFIRPIHWICALHGSSPLKLNWHNIHAATVSFGHRYHHPEAIAIQSAENYRVKLYDAKVMVDNTERKNTILKQIEALAAKKEATAVVPADLLEEVTNLVEWPNALMGSFNESLLKVPAPALITAMQHHQKSFALLKDGQLLPHFILVSNIAPQNPGAVIKGNERVVNARLNDAKFFFETDQKTSLTDLNPRLRGVVFQKQLGSLYDKVTRISKLSQKIALLIGANPHTVEEAALLCKADLMTEMVGEFPELQGVMGRAYADLEGKSKEVAAALEEIYWPRFAGDHLPQTQTGLTLSLADRLDSIIGIFSIGGAPTGDKDPFALRRAAIGVLRLLIENKLSIDLYALLNDARETYTKEIETDVLPQILTFIQERFKSWLHDKGCDLKVIDAVMSLNPTNPYDAYLRVLAVKAFMTLPEAMSLSAANKRVRNLLTKSEDAFNRSPDPINHKLLIEDAEKILAENLSILNDQITPLLEEQNYEAALKQLAALKMPIDNFFDKVMVMVEKEDIRENRISLLNHLYQCFKQIADISRL